MIRARQERPNYIGAKLNTGTRGYVIHWLSTGYTPIRGIFREWIECKRHRNTVSTRHKRVPRASAFHIRAIIPRFAKSLGLSVSRTIPRAHARKRSVSKNKEQRRNVLAIWPTPPPWEFLKSYFIRAGGEGADENFTLVSHVMHRLCQWNTWNIGNSQ